MISYGDVGTCPPVSAVVLVRLGAAVAALDEVAAREH